MNLPWKELGDTVTDLSRVFSDLVRFETRLYNALDDRLRAEHGLVTSQFEFLRCIDARESCRVGDLARELVVTSGAASKGVDRLEAAGWVARGPHPDNRRSSVLVLTDAGARVLAGAEASVAAVLTAALAEPLDDVALTDLAAALDRLRRGVEDAGLGAPRG